MYASREACGLVLQYVMYVLWCVLCAVQHRVSVVYHSFRDIFWCIVEGDNVYLSLTLQVVSRMAHKVVVQ